MTSITHSPTIRTHYEPRWDWYSLTVDGSARAMSERLLDALPHGGHEWGIRRAPKGENGYHLKLELRDEDRTVATVLGEGTEAMGAHLRVTGGDAEDLVPIVRELWPIHRVSRADVAVDFPGGEEAFSAARDCLQVIASTHRVRGLSITPDNAADGATYRLGSPSSDVTGRLYEKWRQAPGTVPDGTVRWETQVRGSFPERKAYLSTAARREVASYTPWSRTALEQLFGDVAGAPPPRSKRRGEHARTVDLVSDIWGKRLMEAALDHLDGPTGLLIDLWAAIDARWGGGTTVQASEVASADSDAREYALVGAMDTSSNGG